MLNLKPKLHDFAWWCVGIVINAMTCIEASNGSLDIHESVTIIICIITSPDGVGFLRIVKKYMGPKVNQLKYPTIDSDKKHTYVNILMFSSY